MARKPARSRGYVASLVVALKPLQLLGHVKFGVAGTITIAGTTAGSVLTVTAGSLPPGMVLNSAARTITGTPTMAGLRAFTLTETLGGATGNPKANALTMTVGVVSTPAAPLDAADSWAASKGVAPQTRLTTAFNEARKKNPYQSPVMAGPPVVAVSAATDATLGAAVALATGGALTAAAVQRIAWYGGKPMPVTTGTKYVALPVSSRLPNAGGNLQGQAGAAGITADMDMWDGAFEVMTDATVIEFGMLGHATRPVTFQIDGEYIDKAGSIAASNSVDNFYKLTFATRKVRRIRVGIGPHSGTSGGTTPCQIRTNATASFWKPDQSQVLKMAWAGDSYGEGQPDAFLSPIGPMAQVAGELLGIRDVRQVSVGGTGYIADGNPAGSRSKFRDQIARWLDPAGALYQGPFDLIVVAHGYNDVNYSAQVQAEALACLKLLRSLAKYTPIVVLGSQAGQRNTGFAALHANTVAVENAIAAAVAQFDDPLCKFAAVTTDPAPWLFGTGKVGATNASGNADVYVDADGSHPSSLANGGGHEALGFRAAAAIRAAVGTMAA